MSEILVVEDDERQRSEIQRALSEVGHRVDATSGGNQALRRLSEKRYDLLMTDLLMDDGTGFEVLEWVGQNAPGLPVIVCSSYAKGENLKTFLGSRFYRILRKPFRPDDLVHQVRELIAEAR